MRRVSIVFVLTVLLPTLAASVYFGALASDVYISESQFVVRNPHRSSANGLGALLQGTSLAPSNDDTFTVHEFVRSRDALKDLETRLKVRSAYGSERIDLTSRFPGLDWDASFENFHRHYQRHVEIAYDGTSSISVLRIRAYTPELARDINEQLLQMGERLVNTLNQRSRQDLIGVAEREVQVAETRAREAATALASFRSDRAVFDPSSESALQLQGVAKLQEDLIAIEAQLAQLQKVAPENPQIAPLRQRAEGLRRVIASQTAKVTGSAGSLSAKSAGYDRIAIEKTFADRQLASAMAALDAARSDAQRKQLYLERLVQPSLPDAAAEPRRVRGVLTVLLLGLVAWGVASLVISGIREHVD